MPAAMSKVLDSALVWFRRDLRLQDNAALFHALKAARQVHCVFVFDRSILDALPRRDRRVVFIHQSLQALGQALILAGGGLRVVYGHAGNEVARLAAQLGVQAVFASHDDEPQALERDAAVQRRLAARDIAWHSSKDHVVFERSEVLTLSGTPYNVFTPYKNAWLKKLDSFYLTQFPVETYLDALAPNLADTVAIPSLASMGFEDMDLAALGLEGGEAKAQTLLWDFLQRIDDYNHTRNFPAVKGPSYLSVHLRFGTVSIRQLARLAFDRAQVGSGGAAVWLSELIWRDFYHQVLHHHPYVVSRSFKPGYDRIQWEQGPQAQVLFQAWCEGRSGYPLVDAAMAQINQTGYMHNRLRMVAASFLVKDLGIDWRWGEAYFAEKLNDFDLAANNGGWLWASSSGCDAQPYFRIFNPIVQSQKFDPQGKFIRRYLPQLSALLDKDIHAPWLAKPIALAAAGINLGVNYPRPVVQHEEARLRTLGRYAAAGLGNAAGRDGVFEPSWPRRT
jgi:deoxyribodipyrimidine photo-lyase